MKDIVFKIREKQIENELIAKLRTDALQQFEIQKNRGFLLFRYSQIELEKE